MNDEAIVNYIKAAIGNMDPVNSDVSSHPSVEHLQVNAVFRSAPRQLDLSSLIRQLEPLDGLFYSNERSERTIRMEGLWANYRKVSLSFQVQFVTK
jgi:hypothetical protein